MGRPLDRRVARLSRNPTYGLCRAACTALVLLCLGAPPALAQGSTVEPWSQAQGGPGHPGALSDGPAPPYRLAWTFRATDGSVSGAVVAGRVVITVGHHAVYGIGLTSGEQIWKLVRNGGPLSMPAVGTVGGRRVLAFVDESTGGGPSLVGVDLGSLRELWRTPLKTTSRSGVTIDGSQVFVADDDGNVYAVDLATGTLLWTAAANGEVLTPPAVSDGHVYVVARDENEQRSQLVALDQANGKPAWPAFRAPVSGSTGSGAAARDGAVVAGFADRVVRELSARDGTERWSALGLSLFSPANLPAFTSDRVYVADVAGGLYAFDAGTGERAWDYQLNDVVVRSSPVVSGSTVLLGLNDGRLVAIDASTGDLVWQSAPRQGLIGAIALSPDLVIAVKGGRYPGLVAYEHDPSGTLVGEPSPTVPNPGRLVGNYALALVVAFVLVLVPSRLLSRRLGPAPFPSSGSLEEDGEWEDSDENEMEGDEVGREDASRSDRDPNRSEPG